MTGLLLMLWAGSTCGLLAVAAAQWRARAIGLISVRRACHELRGPITAARLGLQLGARTGELSPASLHALDLELDRAGLALDDLLRPPTARFPRRAPGAVDAAALIESSVLAWRATARARDVQLHWEWLGESALLAGERPRLAQVTGNLIANAIEHGGGQRGGGEITVRGSARSGVVLIQVQDSGPGLPPAVAQSLDGATGTCGLAAAGGWAGRARRAVRKWRIGVACAVRERSGDPARGHGLVIAQRIAAQHGGRLFAVPCPTGACVGVQLPAVGSASA